MPDYRKPVIPCPEPARGWPTHPPKKGFPGEYDEPDRGAAIRYQRAHPDEIAHETAVQLARNSVVVIVWAVHPDVVLRALRPVYGGSLCVVKSAYAPRVVGDARKDVARLVGSHGVSTAVGPNIGPGGQPSVSVWFGVMTPELDRILAKYPPGLIETHPWLAPVTD